MAPIHLALLCLLPLTSVYAIAASTDKSTPHQAFLHCFLSKVHPSNTSSPLVYTRNVASYDVVLQSSVQNIRFLHSTTTKKPAAIVAPRSKFHVQVSVVCTRENGLSIRVRSGGHDYEGMSYTSGGDEFIAVDLSNLRLITVDPEHTAAWVQAGATLGELYHAIASKNKTAGFTAGTCSTVGVGGHFSGGGIGTLSRKYGTAADNIVDAELVDVEGRIMTREAMGEDLFWAIRGGGAASFGIVLSYKINLVYVPPIVTACNVNKNLRQNATALVSRWQQIAANFDENLYMRVVAQAVNDEEPRRRTIQALFNSLYLGRLRELLMVIKKNFPELGLEAKDCTEMTWLESVLFFNGYSGKGINVLLDRKPQYNSSFKVKSDFVKQPIPETGLENLWRLLLDAKDEPLVLIMEPFGGRLSKISESAIPFPHRIGNLYIIQYFMRWSETEFNVAAKHLNWMKSLYEFMTPYVSSHPRAAYVNYKDIDLGRNEGKPTYLKARVWGLKYFRSNFKRLAYVKGKVDPGNFFRNEQSIPPLLQFMTSGGKSVDSKNVSYLC
ncbi:berberine bridge enzyme-like 23 [Typha angustifolia]|uniref:berberine bridge enzyme-like 23 n=1 Tax=Typha angustifolia TaxID=59011 RepID=UPI003C2B734C